MQGGSYYSKTKGVEMNIAEMIDYHARNAFMKQLALRIGELSQETRKLSNSEFVSAVGENLMGSLFQGDDCQLNQLLYHITYCPDRVPA